MMIKFSDISMLRIFFNWSSVLGPRSSVYFEDFTPHPGGLVPLEILPLRVFQVWPFRSWRGRYSCRFPEGPGRFLRCVRKYPVFLPAVNTPPVFGNNYCGGRSNCGAP